MAKRSFLGLSLSASLTVLLSFTVSPAQVYHSIFDGTTLKGWHPQGGGAWRVTNGMIEGTHTLEGEFGHLVSDSSFTHYRLRYKWKLSTGGNSGLYFHGQEGGTAGIAGAQVEMDDNFPGGIYSTATNPWGWIAQPKAEDIKKWYKLGDWNETVLIVEGSKASVAMNGIPTVESSSPDLGTFGHIAFQVHRGIVMTLWVKDVEMSEVPGTTTLAQDRISVENQFGKKYGQTFGYLWRNNGAEIFSANGVRLSESGFSSQGNSVSKPYRLLPQN